MFRSSFSLPATLQDNAPYTLEAWVLNDSIAENECVADFTTSHDELEKIMLVNGTEPRCGVINHYGWYEDAGYKGMKELTGRWQHIYICFDGRMEQVYINGEQVSGKDIQLLVKPSQFVTLGRNAEGEWPFTGYLHSLKLWDEYIPLQGRKSVSYTHLTTVASEVTVKDEVAEFNFLQDYTAYLPYTTNDKKPMAMAYQNVYDVTPLSKAQPKLAFLPVTVDCGSVKLTLLESDLEAYPGMFVQSQQGKYGLKGVFAPYPDKTDFYPWRKQEYVTETTDFISRSRGSRSYPWRVLAITEKDTDMPVNNLVYALASPNRIGRCV